jgi:hypothetical protein
LAQIIKRISELDYILTFDKDVLSSVFNTKGNSTLYLKGVRAKTISDSFYLCNNGSVIQLNGISETHITGRVFLALKRFYKKPMPLNYINILQSTGIART